MSIERSLSKRIPPPIPVSLAAETTNRLYLWFPIVLEREVLPLLQREAIEWQKTRTDNGIVLTGAMADIERVLLGLGDRLSVATTDATRALRLSSMREPEAQDTAKVTSLRDLVVHARSCWLQDLLIRQQLTTHFQPIVHATETSRVFAYEALLRGLKPDGVVIPPSRLLSFARDAKMLDELNQHAQKTALLDLVGAGLGENLFLNFNPSAGGDPFLAMRSTCRLLKELGIDPQRVVFEICEMDQIQDVPEFRAVMETFRREGYRFALDDLGSGYASLNLLHELRPDYAKIDMGLVRDVHQDAYKAAITQKVIELAQVLGIQTIGEGVEQAEELAWLQRQGVDFVQGYLVAKPAPASALQAACLPS